MTLFVFLCPSGCRSSRLTLNRLIAALAGNRAGFNNRVSFALRNGPSILGGGGHSFVGLPLHEFLGKLSVGDVKRESGNELVTALIVLDLSLQQQYAVAAMGSVDPAFGAQGDSSCDRLLKSVDHVFAVGRRDLLKKGFEVRRPRIRSEAEKTISLV